MWIEILNPENGKTLGAVNTDACDLIKMGQGPEAPALIRNATNSEVYATRISYLRLIDNMTAAQSASLADVQAEAGKPRLVTL